MEYDYKWSNKSLNKVLKNVCRFEKLGSIKSLIETPPGNYKWSVKDLTEALEEACQHKQDNAAKLLIKLTSNHDIKYSRINEL